MMEQVMAASNPLPHAIGLAIALLAFAIVSLLADRIAPVAAAVLYALAIPVLTNIHAPRYDLGLMLLAGGMIEVAALMLGIYWRPLRRRLLGLLPAPWANWFALPISES